VTNHTPGKGVKRKIKKNAAKKKSLNCFHHNRKFEMAPKLGMSTEVR
jgi:hypothetical protein